MLRMKPFVLIHDTKKELKIDVSNNLAQQFANELK